MDLRLSESEEKFRERLDKWLATVKPPAGLRDYGVTPTAEDIGPARTWQRMLYEGGWAGLSWPRSYGGQEASPVEQAIYAEQMARAHLPRQINIVGPELTANMLIEYGRPEQQKRFLPPILDASEVWCQLFSEPGAGSDLAGLSSRAVKDGSGKWRVSGQKVWSSGAQYSEMGLLLARTGAEGEKHKAISCFLLPMDRPGLEVRGIRQMDSETKFNEVFMEDVPVSEEDLLGPEGDGWKVAVSTLGRERLSLGAHAVALFESLTQLRAEAQAQAADHDVFRDRWGELWSRVAQLRMTWFRLLAMVKNAADPRMSMLKLTASELQRDIAQLGAVALGPKLAVGPDGERWRKKLLTAPGITLAGGTSEIQRNVLAERVLGLPR